MPKVAEIISGGQPASIKLRCVRLLQPAFQEMGGVRPGEPATKKEFRIYFH